MFPQLGAPVGFIFASDIFLTLTETMTDAQFFAWGWRIPFLASAALGTFVLFYLMTVCSLGWGTHQLGYSR